MSTAPKTILLRAAKVEYVLLRTPMSFASNAAASKLGDGSRVKSTLDRGVEALDALAERLFATDDQRDAPAAAPVRVTEPATPRAAEPTAEQPPSDDEPDVVELVTEELIEEQDEKPLTGELSDDDELRRVQAELHAKHLIAEQDEQRSD